MSPKVRAEISSLSSHISVRSDSAEVTYHWGDFKHDPVTVLENYFDLFLYEANWGTQRVMFRFDADSVEVEDLRMFCDGECMGVAERGSSVLIDAWFDENWVEPAYHYYDEDDGIDWRLDAFEVIYRQLLAGDYRGLFLLWLKARELDPEGGNGSVVLPGGMAQLGDEHRILVEFLGIDGGVIKAAAERSGPLLAQISAKKELAQHLDKLSAASRQGYLRRLLEGNASAVQNALKRELRVLGKQPRIQLTGETVIYRELADEARRVAEEEARRVREEKERRRSEYLAELGRKENAIWDRVNALVSEKKTKSYDEAVRLLRGLEDLWTTRDDREHFLNAVELIAGEFPRLSGFRRRLEEAGWLSPKQEKIWLKDQRQRWQERNPLEREIDLNGL